MKSPEQPVEGELLPQGNGNPGKWIGLGANMAVMTVSGVEKFLAGYIYDNMTGNQMDNLKKLTNLDDMLKYVDEILDALGWHTSDIPDIIFTALWHMTKGLNMQKVLAQLLLYISNPDIRVNEIASNNA